MEAADFSERMMSIYKTIWRQRAEELSECTAYQQKPNSKKIHISQRHDSKKYIHFQAYLTSIVD